MPDDFSSLVGSFQNPFNQTQADAMGVADWANKKASLDIQRQEAQYQMQQLQLQKQKFNTEKWSQFTDKFTDAGIEPKGPVKDFKIDNLQRFSEAADLGVDPSHFAAAKDLNYIPAISKLKQSITGARDADSEGVDRAMAEGSQFYGKPAMMSAYDNLNRNMMMMSELKIRQENTKQNKAYSEDSKEVENYNTASKDVLTSAGAIQKAMSKLDESRKNPAAASMLPLDLLKGALGKSQVSARELPYVKGGQSVADITERYVNKAANGTLDDTDYKNFKDLLTKGAEGLRDQHEAILAPRAGQMAQKFNTTESEARSRLTGGKDPFGSFPAFKANLPAVKGPAAPSLDGTDNSGQAADKTPAPAKDPEKEKAFQTLKAAYESNIPPSQKARLLKTIKEKMPDRLDEFTSGAKGGK